ncbi:YveK family protein [Cohnella soli]|uniref:YveK family protein n=1 Tax=Cohnella soli TaxID=425005 RepID=A0ABW0I259_9BACL
MEEERTFKEDQHTPASGVKEINLKELFNVIRRRLWIAVVTTIVCAILGGMYSTRSQTPMYASTARIIIMVDSEQMLGTVKAFLREPVVLKQAIAELGGDVTVGYLRNSISVGSVEGTLITLVTAVDTDTRSAARMANATVDAFSKQITRYFPTASAQVLTEADPDAVSAPINPPSNRAFIFGTIAGLFVGIGLIFLVDSLDDTIRTRRDVERQLNMYLLGQTTKFKKRDVAARARRSKTVQKRGESINVQE